MNYVPPGFFFCIEVWSGGCVAFFLAGIKVEATWKLNGLGNL
jgi:hypothetical protein